MKRILKIGRKEKEIIKMIGAGVLITSCLVLPNLPIAFKFLADTRRSRDKLRRSLRRLKQKNLIILSGEKIYLSKKGREIAKLIQAEEIKINRDYWDGTWKVIAWDIPEKLKKNREYFRQKLDDLGFIQIQKSLWVIPWGCKEEIAVLAQNLSIAPYVMYFIAETLPNQEKLIKIFNLD